MCIRDSITAGFHWNIRETRRMLCNGVTLIPHYVTIGYGAAHYRLTETDEYQTIITIGLPWVTEQVIEFTW